MRKLLADSALEKQITETGWVKIPFLTAEEVGALLSFYLPRQDAQKTAGLHYSLASADSDYRSEVNKIIEQVFAPKAKEVFADYKQVFGNFMVKEPGQEGNFPMHQDWTYVEEPALRSAAVWVALDDIDETNGCLKLVTHSHLWGNESRGPFIPWKFDAVAEEVEQKLTTVPLKKGEAIIWDHRTIHASSPNLSDKPRRVATAIFAPNEADIYHYTRETMNGDEVICKRRVNNDFYLKYRVVNMPDMQVPVLSVAPYKPTTFLHHDFTAASEV